MISEIKRGFFLGLGFVIPLAFAGCVVVGYSFYEMSQFTDGFYDETLESIDGYADSEESYIDQISLSPVSETLQGVQLLVAGKFTNNSDEDLNSLEIEAELFNEKGEFVYECSKSFYEKIPSKVTENYLIKCGCSENGVPAYSTVKVRVIKASVY